MPVETLFMMPTCVSSCAGFSMSSRVRARRQLSQHKQMRRLLQAGGAAAIRQAAWSGMLHLAGGSRHSRHMHSSGCVRGTSSGTDGLRKARMIVVVQRGDHLGRARTNVVVVGQLGQLLHSSTPAATCCMMRELHRGQAHLQFHNQCRNATEALWCCHGRQRAGAPTASCACEV